MEAIKVGIIGAMAEEVNWLKAQLKDSQTTQIAQRDFCEGKLGGTDVVVCECGVGKVNAAMVAQTLCERYHVTHLINTGVAGSLNNDINIGDIVVAIDAVHHDMDVCNLGYKPGEIPGMGTVAFPADEGLQKAALEAVRTVAPEISGFSGHVASGDQFVRTQEEKDRIKSTFHADCTEMEGAPIAQVAYLNKVPFVVVRAISDKADGSASMDYPTFEKKAAEHCAKIVEYLVASLSK